MEHRDLYDSLDACRPGSDDLSDPEMAEFAEALNSDVQLQQVLRRSQAFDQALGRALLDLPTPTNLQQTLLEQAAAQQVVLHRRQWLMTTCKVASTVAAVGLGGFAVWRFLPKTDDVVGHQELAESVLQWSASIAWNRDVDQAPTDKFRPAINRRVIGWKVLPEEMGPGAVYLLAPQHGVVAWAVTRRLGRFQRADVSDNQLPREPEVMSGEFSSYGLGAYQQDGFLYLVLVNPKDAYISYVTPGIFT